MKLGTEVVQLSARVNRLRLALRLRPGLRFWLLCVILSVVLVLAIILSVALGAVSVPFTHVIRIIFGHLVSGTISWDQTEDLIIWDFRLPRVLLAAVVGAALAVSGTTLQALVRNPLADPYIFGVSSGAAVGAVAVLTLGPLIVAGFSYQTAAFLGALTAMVLVYLLAQQRGRIVPMRLLLAGVALGYTLQAVMSYLILRSARPGGGIDGILRWLAGSLSNATWGDLGIPGLVLLVVMILLLLQARRLNLLLTGEETATALGINLQRFRVQLFVLTSLLVGTVVSVSGAIGFIGLMIPHIVRLFVGSDHRRVLPLAALSGAVYLVLVDLLGRVLVAPEELPAGIITAALGGPFFLWLLRTRAKGSKESENVS